ncbi:tyrosine-type recombinase/integrase [Methanogenium cariaci]|uniref:tyrosine-type recombinase/integrase n=1 Tax=Methanogenium cariaci TaxID=2197 RepID=UPI00155DC9E5|nr:tyrosine-type recombinase/integrase [Methanogenium cariaci]
MTIGDLYEAVEKIKNGISSRGKPYTRNTQSDLLRILKRFTVWLIENGYSDLNLKKVQKIKIPAYSTKTKSDKDILNEEEVLKIISAAKSIRYRALLSVLFEGGFRIQECADMRWQDVRFTDWGGPHPHRWQDREGAGRADHYVL